MGDCLPPGTSVIVTHGCRPRFWQWLWPHTFCKAQHKEDGTEPKFKASRSRAPTAGGSAGGDRAVARQVYFICVADMHGQQGTCAQNA